VVGRWADPPHRQGGKEALGQGGKDTQPRERESRTAAFPHVYSAASSPGKENRLSVVSRIHTTSAPDGLDFPSDGPTCISMFEAFDQTAL